MGRGSERQRQGPQGTDSRTGHRAGHRDRAQNTDEKERSDSECQGDHKNKYRMTRWLVGENTDMLQCKQKTDIDDHDLSNLTCPSVGMQQGPSIGSSKGAELDPSEVFLSFVCFGAFGFFLVLPTEITLFVPSCATVHACPTLHSTFQWNKLKRR